MLNLVFFLENRLLHWRNGISKFFLQKNCLLLCKILFLLQDYYFPRGKPTSFSMLNLVFFLGNHLLHWKKYRKTDYSKIYYFWCRLLFSKRKTNLVCDVKSCIFLRKPSFTLEKFSKFFLQKNCLLLCKILVQITISRGKPTSFSMLNLVFFLGNHLLHWKNGFSKFFLQKN